MFYPSLTLTLDSLVEFAAQFIGITEQGGDNKGEWIEKFQKTVDGKAQGEPWCVCFVQYCVKEVAKEQGRNSQLYKSESSLEMWRLTPKVCRLDAPIVGAIMVWQMYDENENPTAKGHVGIVSELVSPTQVRTIEGNTSGGVGVIREGDGVYEKLRSLTGSKTMKVVGWLLPWA